MATSQPDRIQHQDTSARRICVVELDHLLVTQLETARGHWGRFRGLMLRKPLPAGAALDIPGCSSIHMMFMRYPIDAVFYDSDRRVTRVGRSVPRWIGFAWGGRKAAGVIEMPAGAASRVAPGQQLEFLP